MAKEIPILSFFNAEEEPWLLRLHLLLATPVRPGSLLICRTTAEGSQISQRRPVATFDGSEDMRVDVAWGMTPQLPIENPFHLSAELFWELVEELGKRLGLPIFGRCDLGRPDVWVYEFGNQSAEPQ